MVYVFRTKTSYESARHRGFTIVELLVVIAVVAILVAMLIPVVNSARASARRTQCQSNMRNFGLAIANYEGARGFYPPGQTTLDSADRQRKRPGFSRQSAVTYLLPYFEEQAAYDQMDLSRNWNDGPNARVTGSSGNSDVGVDLGGILHCPSAPVVRARSSGDSVNVIEHQICDYAPVVRIDPQRLDPTVVDRGTPEKWSGIMQSFENRKEAKVSSDNVTDGVSKTLVFYECSGRPQVMEKGQPNGKTNNSYRWGNWQLVLVVGNVANGQPCAGGPFVNCTNSEEVYGFHRGASAVRADGSTAFLPQDTDPNVFVSMFTMAAGDAVGDAL